VQRACLPLLGALVVIAACGSETDPAADGTIAPTIVPSTSITAVGVETTSVVTPSTTLETTTTLAPGAPLPRYAARAADIVGHDLVGSEITLDFVNDGTWRATAGCNIITGTYNLVEGRLELTGGAMTEMACPPDYQAQDEWLARILVEADVTATGAHLSVVGSDATITMFDWTQVHPDVPLVGTVWRSNGFVDPANGSYDSSATFTLVLDATSLRVDTSCGVVTAVIAGVAVDPTGRYTVDLGSLVTADQPCDDTGARQRADIVRALTGTISIEITGEQMTIGQPDGFQMMLRAA